MKLIPTGNIDYFQSGVSEQNARCGDEADASIPTRRSRSPIPEAVSTNLLGKKMLSLAQVSDARGFDLFSAFRSGNEDITQAIRPLSPNSEAAIDHQWKMALERQKDEDYARENQARVKTMENPHPTYFTFLPTFLPTLEPEMHWQPSGKSPPSLEGTSSRPISGTRADLIEFHFEP
ncbi:hypothetical protein J1614_007425 [Plenodomus biglobosus]|nr:hypothetical protein J1614_007425 [Plenodomus biglobosus]